MLRKLVLLGAFLLSGLCLQAKSTNVFDYLNSNTLATTAEPAAPTGSTTVTSCGSDAKITAGSLETGVTVYWQGTTANGRSTATPLVGYKTVTSSGTYYINANNPSIPDGWSTDLKVVVTISSYIPPLPVIENALNSLAPGIMCKNDNQALRLKNPSTKYYVNWIVEKNVVSITDNYTISKIQGDVPLKIIFVDSSTIAYCRSDTARVTIQMDPVKANFSALNTSIKVGGAVNFTDNSTNAAQWHWTFGTGEYSNFQNPVFYYNSAGKKDVKLNVISTNNCKDSLTRLAYVNVSATDIQNLKSENIVVYPNPVKNFLNVDLTGRNADIDINIYNLMGAKLITSQVKHADGIEKIDVSTLPGGIYMLVLNIDGKEYSTKLTKE